MRVDGALKLARGRMRLSRALDRAARVWLIAALGTSLLLVALRLFGSTSPSLWMGAVPFAVAALAGLVVGCLGVPAQAVAAALDRRLGLKERLGTAQWLAADGGAAERLAAVVSEDADRQLAAIDVGAIRRAFALTVPRHAWIGGLVLAVGMLLSQVLPTWVADQPGLVGAEQIRETKRVREAARQLEKHATDLARIAELSELKKAQQLARQVEAVAREMALAPPETKAALARLSAVERKVDEAATPDARSPGTHPFGAEPGSLSELSRLAEQVDRLDPSGLSLDLDELRLSLGDELATAMKAGRTPALDEAGIRDLADRLGDLNDLLTELHQELQARGADEYAGLTGEQLERLRKLQDLLGRLAEASKANGTPLGDAELQDLLGQLGAMSDAEFERLLELLQELQAAGVLQSMIAQCRSGCSGGPGDPGGGELAAQLRRLAEQSTRPSPGGQGPLAGPGRGGAAARADDDGRGEEPARVPGRVDPRGDLGPRVPFKGIPLQHDAVLEFDATVGQAAAAAEEGLARDLLPPDAKPFVRRYFEALQRKDDKR